MLKKYINTKNAIKIYKKTFIKQFEKTIEIMAKKRNY